MSMLAKWAAASGMLHRDVGLPRGSLRTPRPEELPSCLESAKRSVAHLLKTRDELEAKTRRMRLALGRLASQQLSPRDLRHLRLGELSRMSFRCSEADAKCIVDALLAAEASP